MSERKDVFYDIAAYIDHFAKKILPGRKISHGYYLGGKNKKTREKELSEAANCDVVYATIQLAKEGINIPRLDTLHMITPLTDVEQMIGRVCRPNIGWDANGKPYLKPRKNNSMVVDYVDFKLKNFNDSFQQRFKQYVSLGWKVINERRVLNEGRKEE
jgi:superfamily II DNA or RNA helicase